MKSKNTNIQSDWTKNISNINDKLAIAKTLAEKVKDGDVIGFGSGSTSLLAVKEIGDRVKKESLNITAIPTSKEIEEECLRLKIKTAPISDLAPDWGFDGADEIDENGSLIKGLGGALFNEKKVMKKSPKTYILVDKTKFVKTLGERCPLPIECKKEQVESVIQELNKFGLKSYKLRMVDGENPYITEHGNNILDCYFESIKPTFENDLNKVDGVVENGLFIGYNIEIITNNN